MDKEEKLKKLEKNFIEELKEVRKKTNLSQKAFAAKSGTVREHVTKIEKGLNSPKVTSVIKILEPFGYTITIKKISK